MRVRDAYVREKTDSKADEDYWYLLTSHMTDRKEKKKKKKHSSSSELCMNDTRILMPIVDTDPHLSYIQSIQISL